MRSESAANEALALRPFSLWDVHQRLNGHPPIVGAHALKPAPVRPVRKAPGMLARLFSR